MREILGIILRLSVMYLFALLLVRISGKRSLGNLSSIDFVMTLAVGDLFDNAFWGTSPLSSAFVALAVIIFWHTSLSAISARSKWVDRWISGADAVQVIKDGQLVKAGMDRERTPGDTVFSAMRIQGEDQLEEIKDGAWESSGQLSLQKQDWAKELEKKDLAKLKKVVP